MDKNKALSILESIYKNHYEQWLIPQCPQYCAKEVTLTNGEKITQVMEDAVYDFRTGLLN